MPLDIESEGMQPETGEGMSKVETAATSRRSTEKLDSEEREMQSSDGRGVAHPAKLGVAKKVDTAKTEAAPCPWRLHSSQALSEEADAVACPWQMQPRRKREARARAGQRQASNTETMVMEAAS